MVKKYLVVKLCLMLLVITVLPLSALAVGEAAKLSYTKTICENLLKEKEQFKPHTTPRGRGFVHSLWNKGVQPPGSVKGKGFLQSRFYLSNYLERSHFLISLTKPVE